MVCLMDPVSKGHDAPESSAAQRGMVGHCPCCVPATHAAVPGTLPLGHYGALKHTGLRLWADGGPWAPRRLAAIDYVLRFNGRMPPPPASSWSLLLLEPLRFNDRYGAGQPTRWSLLPRLHLTVEPFGEPQFPYRP